MTSMNMAEARENFAHLVNSAAYGHERIVLTRRGKRVVAIVPVEDLDLLEELEDRIDSQHVVKIREEVEREGSVSWEEVKKELNL